MYLNSHVHEIWRKNMEKEEKTQNLGGPVGKLRRYIQKLFYIIRCIFHMDYKNLFKTVGDAHAACGKPRLLLLTDIVKCGFRYSAGYRDYMLCAFYAKTPAQRATFVTRGINNAVIKLLNDPEYYPVFDDKEKFYETFSRYLHRKWLSFERASDAELEEFLSEHKVFILKPKGACCGAGVEKQSSGNFENAKALRDYAKAAGVELIEEFVVQHPEMDRMAKGAVNTVRIMTVLQDGKAEILFAAIRIGNSDRPVDNINAGGMFAPVDMETGRITCNAIDKNEKVYEKHPKTGCTVIGFQIPYWDEAKKMCLEAAKVVPQIGYAGWDVAVTENGPLLIEGNNMPGHDILPQMPIHTPDNIGYLPVYKKLIRGI